MTAMDAKPRAYRWLPTTWVLMPWAWSLSWLLAGLGFWISVVNALLPPLNFFAYIALSGLGWIIAALVTARSVSGTPFRLIGWLVSGLVSVALGIYWMLRWDASFLGPVLALGVAGLLGGVAGSSRRGAWRWVSGMGLGLVFLVLAALNFYASYLLFLTASSAVISELLWALPGAAFGLLAGFAVRRILGITRP